MAVNFNDLIQTRPVTDGGSKTQAGLLSGQKSLTDSYTTFLSLLTTQLENQDPLSPLDTNAFTQQLVQMTGVQQQLLSNDLLQQLVNQKDDSGYDAVSLIGRTATVKDANAQLASGKADWQYELASAAKSAKLTVTNAAGTVVWEGDAPNIASGRHGFSWDGKDTNGKAMPDGVYTLKVTAKDTADATVATSIYTTAKVTGIEQNNGSTLVTVGGAKVPLSSIVAVTA
jgi:flagellar basal-body rod modification protein FlgD